MLGHDYDPDAKPAKQFRGVWLPARILEMLEAGELTTTEVILLAVIDAYTERGSGCWASNEYLGQIVGVKSRQVRAMLSKLRKLGLVENRSFDGRRRSMVAVYHTTTTEPPREAVDCHSERHHTATDNRDNNNTQPQAAGGGSDDMPFFQETPPNGKAHPSPQDKEHATLLRDAMRAKLTTTRPIRVDKWADHFRKLRQVDSVQPARIRRVLDWYADHMGGPYVPVAPSAQSFRSKFFQIEAAMQRDPNADTGEVTPQAAEIATRLATLHWPKGSAAQLPRAVQASLDALGRVRELIASTRPEDLPANCDRLAHHLLYDGGMPPTGTFVEWWYSEQVLPRVTNWDAWSGRLPKLTEDEIDRAGRAWAQDYTGYPKEWDRLKEACRSACAE